MKLFTKEIDKKLFEQYPKGGGLENQMVIAKVFNPYGRGTWYIINSDPEDPDYLWAIVDLFEVEVGSVNRSDLENAKVKPFMLGFERDTSFQPVNALELYKGLLDGKRYAEGGSIGAENKNMVMNNNVQIMHHAKELSEAVKNAKQIPAWVVAKVYDATQTLSDVTHYLDGENKMAKGGYLIDIINTDGVPNILADGGGVETKVGGYIVDFFNTKANVYASIEIPSENPLFEDNIQIKGVGKTEKEALEDLIKKYKNGKGYYIVKYGFNGDDGYKVVESKPIYAWDEEQAMAMLSDQFETTEGSYCDIISVRNQSTKYAEGGGVENKIKWQDADYGDSARVIEGNKMGVILKPYGRKFHLKFVDGTEKTYDASELEFYNFKAKMAKGGGVDNDVWEKYQIQDKHGYVSYFDDKENALKFLKDNEGSFAIRWDDTEQLTMATGGGIDENEIESSAIFYTDESRWSTKPSISDFESKIQADKESLTKLENKEITPSKIVGGGYKSSAVAKKVATRYLQNRILVNQRAIEILKSRGEVMATGGGVDSIPKAIKDKVNEINLLIDWAKDKDNIVGGYFGTTYYEYLDFEKPIKVSGKFVYIEYNEGGGRQYKERYNTNKKGEYDTNGLVELKQELSRIANAFNRAKRKYEKDGYFGKGGTTKQQKKVAKVMHEFKEGELHSGKSGKVVTDPKQAIAIALSESQKMEQGGNLPYTYSLIRRWSDNMVTDADIDSVIEAMIKAKITDADLVTPPTKTGTQFTKAKEKLNNEIFKKIQGVYVGNLKGNKPYGIIATMVDRATRFDDKTIAEYKKQKTATKSGWKHKKTAKA
jgi:hypothetical protein